MERLSPLLGHHSVRVVKSDRKNIDFLTFSFCYFTKLRFFIFNNSSFSIAIKGNKNSLRFEIDNERHIEDEGIEGLLGFTMAHSYSVSFNLLTTTGML